MAHDLLSPDMKIIYALDEKSIVRFGFIRKRFIQFSSEAEVIVETDDYEHIYSPHEHLKGKFD
ncbi:MAG TPA: hypothetical protein GXZ43_03810 [Clostridiaceae bacterium]|nr:hypothetical protein [Clostridiaceae bacterium]